MHKTKANDEKPNVLIGKFFHTFETEDDVKYVVCQGHIVGEAKPGLFLVEYFDWLSGGMSSVQELVKIDDMTDWRFYDDGDEMRNAYSNEYALRAELRTKRKCAQQQLN